MEQYRADLSDEELIKLWREGDGEAVNELFRRCRPLVYWIVRRKVPEEFVEDVTQMVFLNTFQSLDGFRGRASFNCWLGTLTRRCCFSWWRSYKKRSVEVPLSCLEQQYESGSAGALKACDVFQSKSAQKDSLDVLKGGLGRLQPKDRRVLTLRYVQDRSVSDTAKLLGCSKDNVKVKAFRAKRNLRQLLSVSGVKSDSLREAA